MVIKKLIQIFMIVLLSMSMANALSMSYDQSSNLAEFENAHKGNSLIDDVYSHENEAFLEINNNTYYRDYTYEFSNIDSDFYLVFENYYVNSTIQLLWRGDLNQDPTLYMQNFSMLETGRYIFKFEKDNVDELGKVYLNYESQENEFATTLVEYVPEQPRGMSELVSGIVGSFEQVIDYNVTLWKIMLYLVIFVLTIGFIGITFGVAMYLFGFAKNIRESKGSIMHHNERGGKED